MQVPYQGESQFIGRNVTVEFTDLGKLRLRMLQKEVEGSSACLDLLYAFHTLPCFRNDLIVLSPRNSWVLFKRIIQYDQKKKEYK